MIISAHLPKIAGKRFHAALEMRFRGSLLEDYGSFPISTPKHERQRAALEASLANAEADLSGVECIHGHLLPVKYFLLATRRDLTFVTWARYPIQRPLSHYHYWWKTYQPGTSPPLHRKVVEENWSVKPSFLGEEMRVRAHPRHDRHFARRLDTQRKDLVMLGLGKSRRFARRAARHQAMYAFAHLPRHQLLKRARVHRPVFERGHERGVDALESLAGHRRRDLAGRGSVFDGQSAKAGLPFDMCPITSCPLPFDY
jgi:hypothetical protein